MTRFQLRVLVIAIVCLAGSSSAAQHTTKRKTAVATPPSSPLHSCGITLRIPPGWELTPAAAKEKPSLSDAQGQAVPSEACSFTLAPKYPSELVRNTDAEGPVGRMEIRIIDGDIEAAAPLQFQRDEQGWFVLGPKGMRYSGKLTTDRRTRMQILSAVVVQSCYDLNGRYRGLCEVNHYVYSNGRRSALITAGPYLGETEYVVLNSLRFTSPAPAGSTRKKSKK